MIDYQILRENPEIVRETIRKKKFACDLDAILRLDKERRAAITATERLRAEQKAANSEMARLEKGSPAFREKIEAMKDLSAEVKARQAELQAIEKAWGKAVLTIPNILHESVPEGGGEEENQIVKTSGDPGETSPWAVPHYEIPGFHALVDLASGTKVTGAGFPFFMGEMARLVRSLLQFFLGEAEKAGYREIMPPLLVNAASATATGQLPDKEGQMYELPKEGYFLIPTAEVPITNYFRDTILKETDLPINICGYTPCFRREAGSYGKEVRGLNRTHQFDKVELVKWVHPATSFDELERLVAHAGSLLEQLQLPWRVLLMCSGEIGFPHAKQYDIEVWAAGQKRWLEVSSCSNFTDFQARRAGIRFRGKDGKIRPVHTLNGSALAVPRTLAALLENNLLEDGRVALPEKLGAIFGKAWLEFPN